MLTTGRDRVAVEPDQGGSCRVVDRGPNWLFIRVASPAPTGETRVEHLDLASDLWEIGARHFVYRMVVEMDAVDAIDREAADDLVALRERLAEHGGALRLCGLSDGVAAELEAADASLSQNHATRHAAVVGDPDEAAEPPAAPIQTRYRFRNW